MPEEISKTGPAGRFASDPLMAAADIAQQSFPTSKLYIVGLPIGNAADITLRALWVLEMCDVIACEDTRQTKKLLERYGIRTPTVSVHEHNERSASRLLIDKLAQGARVALVTDAGTPAVSDPGARAVDSVRRAGFGVTAIPGACAAVTALSAAGLESYAFTFAGFVPPAAAARRRMLSVYGARDEAFILYEAPHRIKDLACDLAKVLSAGRRVVIARELTKRFETFEAMTAAELPAWAAHHEPRGEYVIAVDMDAGGPQALGEDQLKWAREIVKELPLGRASALVARVTGLKRDDVYRLLSGLSEAGGR